MARKSGLKSSSDGVCRDCLWLTERYNMNYKGEPVLGRCRHSEHAVLLSGAACKQYKERP